MASKPRVVLDTNVLISALVFGGVPRQATNLVGEGEIIPVMSEEIATELRRSIALKFPTFSGQGDRLEQLLRRYGKWVKLGALSVNVSRDPDDNRVIETAVIAGCSYIVSGDKDLLVLREYGGVRIVTPADVIEHIK